MQNAALAGVNPISINLLKQIKTFAIIPLVSQPT